MRRLLRLGVAVMAMVPFVMATVHETQALGPGSWSAASGLNTGRNLHTATRLQNGDVLVAGGYGAAGYLASAERYSAATGAWTTVGSLATARREHAAAILDGGTVLVAGGRNAAPSLATAERFDPGTNTWTAAGTMSVARYEPTATTLNDGRVLVAGGSTDGVTGLTSAEIYNPTLNAWFPVASMAGGRAGHTATLLPDGRVLVTGGATGGVTGALQTAEIYNPSTNTWTSTPNMSVKRVGHTATLLTHGQIVVAGGYNGLAADASSELYDPATNSWSGTGSMPGGGRYQHSATLLNDGTVVVAGGADGLGGVFGAALRYDPFANAWTTLSSMTNIRYAHGAALLTNGKLMVVGGSNNVINMTSVELFDPGAWASANALATGRRDHTTTTLATGNVLVAGGNDGTMSLESSEVYTVGTNTWSAAGDLATPRELHTTNVLQNGLMLAVGGRNGSTYLTSAELFNPIAGTWSTTSSMTTARANHTATMLADGRILVVGGENGSGAVATAELYDPATNTWSSAGSLTTARSLHIAADVRPVAGGISYEKVIVAGGTPGGTSMLSTTEIYDVAANTWSAGASMTLARAASAAATLPDGRLLVAGGANLGPPTISMNASEIYSPDTNTWAATGAMFYGRAFAAITRTVAGRILVTGGLPDLGSPPTATGETFDPATGTWSMTSNMMDARSNTQAAPLPDGSVLIAGGRSAASVHTSAERYTFVTGLATPGQDFIFPLRCVKQVNCYYNGYKDDSGTDYNCGSAYYPTHKGTDIPLHGFATQDAGIDVVAVDGGTVLLATDGMPDRVTTGNPFLLHTQQAPNIVVIGHPSGRISLYLHLRKDSIIVRAGQQVTRGQKIAQVGSSGVSTGPHLHMEFWDGAGIPYDAFSGPCNPRPSEWVVQDPYIAAFSHLPGTLVADGPTLDNVPPPSFPLSHVPPSATQVCYSSIVFGLPAGDTLAYEFNGPGGASSPAGPAGAGPFGSTIRNLSVGTCTSAATLRATPGTWTFVLKHNGTPIESMPFQACAIGSDDDCDAFQNSQQTLHLGPVNTSALFDNCPAAYNTAQTNNDGNFVDNSPPYVSTVDDKTRVISDALGDACDADDDNDGLSDATETNLTSLQLVCPSSFAVLSATLADTDGDRVNDRAECAMSTDPNNAVSKPANPSMANDPDNDRLSTLFETLIGTNPASNDTDGDFLQDGWEYKGHGSNPLVIDSDGDGVRDSCEVASLNGDTIVNPGDQALLASEILRIPPPPKLANFDLNQDGVINPGDQAFQASRVGPGKCP